jgi:hypothetical protein
MLKCTFFCFIFFISPASYSGNCDLISIFNDKLIKREAKEDEYFKRIYPLLAPFTAEEERYFKQKYLELDESSFLNFEEYKRYVKYDRTIMLSFLTSADMFSQKCDESDGILKIKLDIEVMSNQYNRFTLNFRKLNGEWLFRHLLFTHTSIRSSRNYDDGVIYQSLKGIKRN